VERFKSRIAEEVGLKKAIRNQEKEKNRGGRRGMKKRMSMKPVLLVELLMIAVLFGVGSAFAITVNPLPNQLDPWAGEENITESANLAVSNYDFNYNADLTGVSGVTVTVSNSDTLILRLMTPRSMWQWVMPPRLRPTPSVRWLSRYRALPIS
jgi:hypothetical protein